MKKCLRNYKLVAQKYDLIQPSDYMVKTMAKMDLLAPLDKKNIPNIENMVSNFKTPAFDPENKYS